MADLIADVKAKGDKASYGTTAPTGQVAGALMKTILKLPIVEVPYRTAADSVNDLDSGAVDYMMYDPIFAMPRAREGKLRVLAISSKERMATAPDIPTMHESGVPGVDVLGWWGAIVPAGVPARSRRRSPTPSARWPRSPNQEMAHRPRRRSVGDGSGRSAGAHDPGRQAVGRVRQDRGDGAEGLRRITH